MTLTLPGYRADIDGLRALAILLVVAFHAFPGLAPGGFVGVDVFFVVSGYLITQLVLRSLEGGGFSFLEFYSRRIRRIFPALLVVLVAVAAAGALTLFAFELRELGKHIAAGAAFVSNFVLWREAGYFDRAAEAKPLLHLWSLAIEEQFYLVWPAVVVLAWKHTRLAAAISTLALLSFALNLALSGDNSVAAFYSPASRFFELLAGGWLANAALRKPLELGDAAAVAGLGLILACAWIIDRDSRFPGWWALGPTIGASLVIAAGPHAWLNRALLARPAVVWIGLVSYPLYLWHWPALTFARIVEGRAPSTEVTLAVLLASLGLAWLTYRLIERPLRYAPPIRPKVVGLCAAMTLAGLAGLAVHRYQFVDSDDELARELREGPPARDTLECRARFGREHCMARGEHPRVLIIGDSHAADMYVGLSQLAPAIDLLSAGPCAPLDGVFLELERNAREHPCTGRVDPLAGTWDMLARSPDVRTVLVAAYWVLDVTGEFRNPADRTRWGSARLVEPGAPGQTGDQIVRRGLERTLKRLSAKGLRVVLVRGVPTLDRALREQCRLTPRIHQRTCTIPKADFLASRKPEDELLAAMRTNFPDLLVFDPLDSLCDATSCYFMRDGVLLYRDHHHLSRSGARLVATDLRAWMSANGF